ncbi:histone-lysine N-methyltransferase SETDB2-like [Rhinophrynus dorsalis]
MRRAGPPHETANPTIILTQETNNLLAARELSLDEAQKFWRDRLAEGKVDLIFEQMLDKLKMLWQRIKDGSATSQEYLKAVTLVKESDLDDTEAPQNSMNMEDELPDNADFSPTSREDLSLDLYSECETGSDVLGIESSNRDISPATERVSFGIHRCGQSCLSKINPYLSKRENPLKLPVLCHFQRWHAKTGCLDKELDVIYKAPCGKSLRSFEEVRFYLFQTECRYLFLDNFSFNTYVQLDRTPSCNSQVIVQDSDISKDVESVPVSFCNEIDGTRPSSFIYRKCSWPNGYSISNFTDIFIKCCTCTDGCLDISKCACLQLTAKVKKGCESSTTNNNTPGYSHKRLKKPVPTGLYECNVSCTCDRKLCQNRVVQHGIQVRLQVFKTKRKGWGVRCLDDIDKGTFVCTYAGRILRKSVESNVKNVERDPDASDKQDKGDVTTDCSSAIVNERKRKSSHSDSEIMLLNVTSSSRLKLTHSPLLSVHSQPETNRKKEDGAAVSGKKTLGFSGTRMQCSDKDYGPYGRSSTLLPVKRPKTKTSMLQKRRIQLMEEGASTVQHSSEDECATPPLSPKQKAGTSAGKRLDEDKANKAMCPAKMETSKNEKVDEPCVGYISEESNSSVISGVHPLEKNTFQDTGDGLSKSCLLVSSDAEFEENVYILDASKEGNVGRFLNHSCCPNLFVQNVFVETHHKGFPWVAFFTNRLVKAGTELTWDYNYEVGSVPEKEITCLCGHPECRNIIV